MDIILNQVAIWRASGAAELNKRTAPAGTSYRVPSSPIYLKSAAPIVRYCKDYKVGKGKATVAFCLFVRIGNMKSEASDAVVEKQLDDIAATITVEEALRYTANSTDECFTYLPKLISLEDE